MPVPDRALCLGGADFAGAALPDLLLAAGWRCETVGQPGDLMAACGAAPPPALALLGGGGDGSRPAAR